MEDLQQMKKLAKLLASQFIARPDVKARQSRFGGTYAPDRTPIEMKDLILHLQGKKTIGHYMVNTDDTVKLFAFDVDLEKLYPADHPAHRPLYLPTIQEGSDQFSGWEIACPRTTWMSRQQGPAREFMKNAMHRIASSLVLATEEILEIKALAAYSGSKGIHVYGFTGKDTPAALAREAAQLVLKELGWELYRGQNVYMQKKTGSELFDNPMYDWHQFTLEVYPKQDSLDGKDLGNLMRLPLGINYKSPKDGAFFMDLRTPYCDMVSMDPIEALTTTNIWAYKNDQ